MATNQNTNAAPSPNGNRPPVGRALIVIFVMVFVLTYAASRDILYAFITTLIYIVTPFFGTTTVLKHYENTHNFVALRMTKTLENHKARIIILLLFVFSTLTIALFAFIHPDTCSRFSSSSIQTAALNQDYLGVDNICSVFGPQLTNNPDLRMALMYTNEGNAKSSIDYLKHVVNQASNNALLHILLENQEVRITGEPYFILIAGTILTGVYQYMGTEQLQAVYADQQKYNQDTAHKVKELVKIANFGSDPDKAQKVAQQIADIIRSNPAQTVVGVLSPPLCSQTQTLATVLESAKVAVVSPLASCDDLTNNTDNLFEIAPPDKQQACAVAQKAKADGMHRIAVFESYAIHDIENQASDFKECFSPYGKAFTETYTPDSINDFQRDVQDLLQQKPDAIFFAGFPDDASLLLQRLPTTGPLASTTVFGLNTLYIVSGYRTDAKTRAGLWRLQIASAFYPDMWDILHARYRGSLFNDYRAIYDPKGTHPQSYGYVRFDSVVALSYDASEVLLQAVDNSSMSSLSPSSIMERIMEFKGDSSIQGVTGQIAFDTNNTPMDKAIVFLWIDKGTNDIHMDDELAGGCFLKSQCEQYTQPQSILMTNMGNSYRASRCVPFKQNNNGIQIIHRCL